MSRTVGLAAVSLSAVNAYNRAWANNATRREALTEAGKAALPGLAATAVSLASGAASRLILPVTAVANGVMGAREDTESPVRGFGRGLVRTVDPTGLFMARGLGEQAYDHYAGRPEIPQPTLWQQLTGEKPKPALPKAAPPKRLSPAQQQQFQDRNATFQSEPGTMHGFVEDGMQGPPPSNRGYANPSVQRQMQLKRGVPENRITPWARGPR